MGLESDIVEQFKAQPQTVRLKMEQIGQDIQKGKPIRSGWAVLRASLKRAGYDVTVDDGAERTRRERAARAFIRNVGLYYSSEQVLDELFGNGGLLAEWTADANLQAEMIAYWQELRPRGVAAEAESITYQKRIYGS